MLANCIRLQCHKGKVCCGSSTGVEETGWPNKLLSEQGCSEENAEGSLHLNGSVHPISSAYGFAEPNLPARCPQLTDVSPVLRQHQCTQ